MSARQKLNFAFLNGSLLLAGILGLATDSGIVFVVALVVLLAGNLIQEEIRFRKKDR